MFEVLCCPDFLLGYNFRMYNKLEWNNLQYYIDFKFYSAQEYGILISSSANFIVFDALFQLHV